ncbi:MAG: hypothetical protein M1823_000268 [Watsoniomyces obsoletus]|nr:MAG: hypothetical protein M1823_000268 [Watsoniomyces obsoletus]
METLEGQYDWRNSTSGRYTVAINQWGRDESGKQVLRLQMPLRDDHETTAFSTTWNWDRKPEAVHAYPNVRLNDHRLPLALKGIRSLDVDVTWSMEAGAYGQTSGGDQGLNEAGAVTNVAFDLFLDPDPAKATSTTIPKYEIMIWMGRYGGVLPIGWNGGKAAAKHRLGDLEFQLFRGSNDHGQEVFSWVSNRNITNYRGDLSPLIHYIWREGWIEDTVQLGVFQFGTESLHTANRREITFDAQRVKMHLEPGEPKPLITSAGTSSRARAQHVFLASVASFVMLCSRIF